MQLASGLETPGRENCTHALRMLAAIELRPAGSIQLAPLRARSGREQCASSERAGERENKCLRVQSTSIINHLPAVNSLPSRPTLPGARRPMPRRPRAKANADGGA